MISNLGNLAIFLVGKAMYLVRWQSPKRKLFLDMDTDQIQLNFTTIYMCKI